MTSAHLKQFAKIKTAEIEWRNDLPFSLEFDDIYYSLEGGDKESHHVFIEGCDLKSDWRKNNQHSSQEKQNFTLVELGFGSGLNFFTTAKTWQNERLTHFHLRKKHLHYISIEKRPFSYQDFKKSCDYWQEYSVFSKPLLKSYPSATYGRHQIDYPELNLTLTLIYMPVDEALEDLMLESNTRNIKTKIDYWFLDGFSPAKNESMWAQSVCENIAKLCSKNSKLATFSVASIVKKALISVGFTLKKSKGFGKKREMLTAQFDSSLTNKNQSKFINLKYEKPWVKANYKKVNNFSNIAIIGAGLAGCATAYQFSKKGIKVDLYDAESDIAQKASGAAAGIFHPQLTSDMNDYSQYSWSGYLYLLLFLSSLTASEKSKVSLTKNNGITRLLKDSELKKQIVDLSQRLNIEYWLKPSNTNAQRNNAIEFPHATAININVLCQLLLKKADCLKTKETLINKYFDHKISQIKKISNLEKEHWKIEFENNDKRPNYDHIIYCGGANSNLINFFGLQETHFSRGQTCYFQSDFLAKNIQQTICEKSYIVPQNTNSQFHLGATFEDFIDDSLNQESQNQLLDNLNQLLQALNLKNLSQNENLINVLKKQLLKGTVGYRLHSQDRLPIVGAALDRNKLNHDFKNLGQKRLQRNEISYYNQSGLWVNTAYGSHGLLNSLLASAHLVAKMTGDVSPLSYRLSNAIQPTRFAIKALLAKK